MNERDPFNLRRKAAAFVFKHGILAPANSNLPSPQTDAAPNDSGELDGLRVITDSRRGDTDTDSMWFAVPSNIPNFVDPQRRDEDSRWESSGVGYTRHTTRDTTSGRRTGGFFDKQELPMYKDKPYGYAASSRARRSWRRKTTIGGVLGFLALLYWLGFFSRSSRAPGDLQSTDSKSSWWFGLGNRGKSNWNERRERVKDAFVASWDAYDRYAWGQDEFHPISKNGRQMVPGGLGWIIVDSLDTLMIMNLTSRLSHAREWLATNLTWEKDSEVNTFETTIRMLGGLLSAHYLSTTYPDLAPLTDDNVGAAGEDLYVEKAKDLADRLLGAYNSDSGIPYASVNLKSMTGVPSHDDGGASSTAEAGTVQLEMKYMAHLTGEKEYWDRAEQVMKVIDDNGAQDGLVPIFIYATTGLFRGNYIRLGSRGDSYYEYLIKQYLQTSQQEPIYLEMWEQALAGVRKHLLTYTKPSNLTILGELPNGIGRELSPKMDHLVCFMPGTIALAVTGGRTEAAAKAAGGWGEKQEREMQLARELMQTCWGMYKATATGLAAEITHFNIYDPPLKESDGQQHVVVKAGPEIMEKSSSSSSSADDGATWKSEFIVKSQDAHNLQRPETVESLFYLWRITQDDRYRQWGWEMFEAFMTHTVIRDENNNAAVRFTSLDNVNSIPPKTRDNMESFWLAETLKYFYLLFSPPSLLPLDHIVINTEAHIFPRFPLGQIFTTGWHRRKRDLDTGRLARAVVVER